MLIQIITSKMEPRTPLIPLKLEDIMHIVIHHAQAKTATWEDINYWHKHERGWNCGGYNEYIRKDGSVYIMRGDNVGAQCENMNSISYGICCEGDYNTEKEMPMAQFSSLIERIRVNRNRFPNLQGIEPHKKFCNTECPGQYFPLEKIYNSLAMPVIRFGSKGDTVTYLQNQLNKKGFDCGVADGIFGNKTLNAVKHFQADNGLDPDGVVGPLTWSKI